MYGMHGAQIIAANITINNPLINTSEFPIVSKRSENYSDERRMRISRNYIVNFARIGSGVRIYVERAN